MDINRTSGLSLLVCTLALLWGGTVVWAGGTGPGISADQALTRLQEGNARFVADECMHPRCDAARRKQVAAEGQHPFATVITCSDSRVPVELLFDQGIGDIFVIRVAGNVCDVGRRLISRPVSGPAGSSNFAATPGCARGQARC